MKSTHTKLSFRTPPAARGAYAPVIPLPALKVWLMDCVAHDEVELALLVVQPVHQARRIS